MDFKIRVQLFILANSFLSTVLFCVVWTSSALNTNAGLSAPNVLQTHFYYLPGLGTHVATDFCQGVFGGISFHNMSYLSDIIYLWFLFCHKIYLLWCHIQAKHWKIQGNPRLHTDNWRLFWYSKHARKKVKEETESLKWCLGVVIKETGERMVFILKPATTAVCLPRRPIKEVCNKGVCY